MAKLAIPDAKRGISTFILDPSQVTLVTDKKHWLYQARVERPVSRAMVEALLGVGFTDPIDVAKEGDAVLVVDGRGRVKAMREANTLIDRANALRNEGCPPEEMAAKLGLPEDIVRRMPQEPLRLTAIVVRGDEADLVGRSVMANQLREADDDPISQARQCVTMLGRGKTEEEVRRFFGQSLSWVKGRLKLLEAAPEVRKALQEGTISVSDVIRMAGQPVEEQKKTLAATPKKDPADPTKRRAGKRGKCVRPTKATMVKMLDYMGEGSEGALWLRFVLGADGAVEALLKKHKGLGEILDKAAKRRAKKKA